MSGIHIYGACGVGNYEALHIKGYGSHINVRIFTPYKHAVWSRHSVEMKMGREEIARIVDETEKYMAKTKTPTASDDSSDTQQVCEATPTSCEGAHEVAHPSYYNQHPSGVECIDIAQHYCFLLGNVIKYVWRAGLKNKETYLEDLEKAAWYLRRKIEQVKAENKPKNNAYEVGGIKLKYPDGDLIYSEFGKTARNRRFIVTGSSSGIKFTIDEFKSTEFVWRHTVVLTYEQVTYMIGSLRRTFLRNDLE